MNKLTFLLLVACGSNSPTPPSQPPPVTPTPTTPTPPTPPAPSGPAAPTSASGPVVSTMPPPVVCGDGVCAATESCQACRNDCGACPPPAAWTCGAERYDDGSTCDCRCGAEDPDCDDKGCIGPECNDNACERCPIAGDNEYGRCQHEYGACEGDFECADGWECVTFQTGKMCSKQCNGTSVGCEGSASLSGYCLAPVYGLYWCMLSCSAATANACPNGTECKSVNGMSGKLCI